MDEIAVRLMEDAEPVRRHRQAPLPSFGDVEGWHARLLGPDGTGARAWLRDSRHVSSREVRAHRIGWDGKFLKFPMVNSAGDLAALKYRAPNGRAQMLSLSGTFDWPLYPTPDPKRGWTLLVAGELDALAARSAGLPASSVTLGAGYLGEQWATWTDDLRGLRVVVAFDNNEAEQGRAVVARLRAEGINVGRLDLRDLGLKTEKGDVSDYLAAGGDPARLRRPSRWVRLKRGAA